MTIGVAAVANNGKAIVLMADKQVEAGGLVHEAATKMRRMRPAWYVLIAGEMSAAIEAIEQAEHKVASGLAEDVRKAVHEAWHGVRWARVEDAALRPLGLTWPAYLARDGDDGLARVAREAIAVEMGRYQCDLLVCGFDPAGAHIFSISADSDGSIERHDEGWAAVGSGATLAQGSLDMRQVAPDEFNLDLIIYTTFEAKGRAETADGVGWETDGWIICPGKAEPKVISQDTFELLDKVLDLAERLPFNQHRFESELGYKPPATDEELGDWQQVLRMVAAVACE